MGVIKLILVNHFFNKLNKNKEDKMVQHTVNIFFFLLSFFFPQFVQLCLIMYRCTVVSVLTILYKNTKSYTEMYNRVS